MDDVARAAAEDGVELVLAVHGEKQRVAALLEADELLVAEVPAARPLVEVAADRALVADLRRADFDRRRARPPDTAARPRACSARSTIFIAGADLQAAVWRGVTVASSAFLTLTMRSGCVM